jgi:hypothetical protein
VKEKKEREILKIANSIAGIKQIEQLEKHSSLNRGIL